MFVRIGSVLCGCLCGAGIFFFVYDPAPVAAWRNLYTYPQRYSGRIESDDRERGTITMLVESDFLPTGTSTARAMSFAYDDLTRWYAIDYQFKGETLYGRRTGGSPHVTLPEGTLVSILQEDAAEGGPLRASAVVILHRTSL